MDGERERADAQLLAVLEKLIREKKKKPSIVHIWSPSPGPESQVPGAIRRLKSRHIEVRWTLPAFEPGLTAPSPDASVQDAIIEAVRLRVRASQTRAERAMRGFGIRAKTEGVRIAHVPMRAPDNAPASSPLADDPETRRDPPRPDVEES